jgi:hypothetical protein
VQGIISIVYEIHTSRLILIGNRTEGLIGKAEEEEEEDIYFTSRIQGPLNSWQFFFWGAFASCSDPSLRLFSEVRFLAPHPIPNLEK